MISKAEPIRFQPKNLNTPVYMENQCKNEIFNSDFREPIRIRQSSSLRQMTWVPNSTQSSNSWNANESTFLTNVNSISSLDPVVQSYVDQQINAEFAKLIKPYSDSIDKLKELFEKHLNEEQVSFNNNNSFQNKFQEKCNLIESKMMKLDNINSENEQIKKEIKDNANSIITFEEILKTFDEKLINLESSQNKNESNNSEMESIKEFINRISSINDSTISNISQLQEKYDSCSNYVKVLEAKITDAASLIRKENEEKFIKYQNEIENKSNDIEKKICEINSKIDRYIQLFNNHEKLFDKFALKNNLDDLQKFVNTALERNDLAHNQIQKDFRTELEKLKEKIEMCEKNQTKHNETIQIQNDQKAADGNSIKIQNLDKKIQELNIKVLNLESSIQSFNLLPTTVSLIQERIVNINKEEIFLESQINNLKNDIEKIKLKLSKLDRLSLVTFQSTVDIIGNGAKGQFDLTIGEPDLSTGGSGIHLFLPKSYQDYTFHYDACPIFEHVLKEPIEPKSTRRKQKNRKLKK